MKLNEWATHHIRFKDCMRKQIKEMEVTEDHIRVVEKKEEKNYYVTEKLSEAIGNIKNNQSKQFIITKNSKENIEFLIDNWNRLKQYRYASIIFVNVKENKMWHIHPATHHFIADKDKLEEGIWRLHESIPVS
ncbi:MAG: hypothetical protein ACQESE_00800 [Nanobdellota archaeon]